LTVRTLRRRSSTAIRILRERGLRGAALVASRNLARTLEGSQNTPIPVDPADLLAAPSAPTRPRLDQPGEAGQLVLNWVIPYGHKSSGGHTTIFRCIRYLEEQGHLCRIYVYGGAASESDAETAASIQQAFPGISGEISLYRGTMKDCHAVFATAWPTAYPVARFDSCAKRFYFVQDLEAHFYPVGSLSTLAENTYRLGLHGITAGRWLSQKLSTEYGMPCDSFDFASDGNTYFRKNSSARDGVLFYARPVTPRRGFELGCIALKIFHDANPGYKIHLVGWDVRDYSVEFPHVNHGIVSPDELNELYNECCAALVLSFTNLSLLPLELLSAGCVPVLNEGPNNRLVLDNEFVRYAPPTPGGLADTLTQVVRMPDLESQSTLGAASVISLSWSDAFAAVEAAIRRNL